MECITIICDDRTFKTRRRTVDGFFSLEKEQTNLKLDTDPTYFLPLLEELRENFETLVSNQEFRNKINQIRVADLELDVGGTTFWTSRETLSRSDYFKATFNWGQPITFIDRNPEKFRQLLNYLREIETDPGDYADFYLIERPIDFLAEDELNPEKVMEPYIRREKSFMIENRLGLSRSPILGFNNQLIKQSYIKNTDDQNLIRLSLNLSKYGSMIDNIKLVSNRGIKKYQIMYGEYNLIIEDDHQNSYLLENLKSCPKLYVLPYHSLHFTIELTGPGYLQLIFDLHPKSSLLTRQIIPQNYNLIKYYGRSNKIDALINQCFNRHTIMFMIRRDAQSANLVLKDPDQRVLFTSDPLSSIEYAIKNKLDPGFIYVPIHERLRYFLHNFLIIEISQTVDIWMVNRYTLEYINGMAFIK